MQTNLKTLKLSSFETVTHGAMEIALNSKLEQLELVSLKHIEGVIRIYNNTKLCYADSLDWNKFSTNIRVVFNQNISDCGKILFNY